MERFTGFRILILGRILEALAKIIEVLVSEGDIVEENQDIITLESDKAAMEIPSTAKGKTACLRASAELLAT